jgi:DNA-binding NarL/FixJ family response regulator
VSLSRLDRSDDIDRAGGTDGADQADGPAADATPSPQAWAGRPAERPSPAPRVLVVDDTSSMRAEISALLEDSGFEVVGEASHGAEGVMLARRLRPDVVVMDVRMPILDGIAATGLISRELPDTKVIVFSAFDDQALEQTAREAGARFFLTKGATPVAITDAVRDAASNH